jgi:hypothetical protein
MIYLPRDYGCRWHTGGPEAREAFAIGAGIYFFITVDCREMYKPAPAPAPAP